MSLHLLRTVLDAHDAAELARLNLATRYEIALNAGDELDLRRVVALASDYDMRHPDQPPVLAEITGQSYPAAA